MSNTDAKKRIMYLSGEDFYLYCYSVFIILDSLGCREGKYFRDYRKLAFLTDIINDEKVVYVITNPVDGALNPKDYECLLDSYSNGLTRRSEILKLLFVLEKKGYITLERGKSQEINVSLNKNNLPNDFFSKKIFEYEYSNAKSIAKTIKKLGLLTLETMLNKIYVENGVKTWVS